MTKPSQIVKANMKKKYQEWQAANPSPTRNLPPSGAFISQDMVNEYRRIENDAYLKSFIDSVLEFLDEKDELDRS